MRLTTSSAAARRVVMPAANWLMADYPDMNIGLAIDSRFIDIAKESFDAGIRLGESLDKDMIDVRIGSDFEMVVAGAPACFQDHPVPETPHDLTAHNCINLRLQRVGGLYAWEFEKDGHSLHVRVEGQFTCSEATLAVDAALAGRGLVCLPSDQFDAFVSDGRRVRVLEDWCPPFAGYHLYYPRRRQVTSAFRLLMDGLRWRG